MFHTVYEIKELRTTHGGSPRPLVGVSIGGRLGVVYSQDGLNDTPAHRPAAAVAAATNWKTPSKST